MQLRAQRSGCETGHAGNFFVRITFDIVQHERATHTWRQSSDCALEVDRRAYILRRRNAQELRVGVISVVIRK